MRTIWFRAAVLGLLLANGVCAAPVRVLILTGESDLPYHDWRVSTPFLRNVLENTGRFDVKVLEEPRGLTAATLSSYDVLVLNYNGPRWGQAAETAVEDLIRSGKGMIAVHGVSYGAFFGMELRNKRWTLPEGGGRGWPAYAEMMGATWKPENIGHSARHVFSVRWLDREHPISRGLEPAFQANDELYHKMDLRPNARVLAAAYSDPAMRGTGKDEPQIWTVAFGKGRVVHMTLGHDLTAMRQPGFLAAFARGTEWAATGAVTLLPSAAQPPLPGTAPLRVQGDLAMQMVDGIHAFLAARTAEAARQRTRIVPDRERLRRILGIIDTRVSFEAPEQVRIGSGAGYQIYAVRWPVFRGVSGVGLLLQPGGAPVARVIALPDADWTPEMLAGLAPGVDSTSQFARRLAENGCQVIVPVLIDRRDTWSGIPGIRMTNQPHREFLYRMAFEVGRHIIGYEVQKVLALVDWFERQNRQRRVPIAVAGYGEGGLIGLHSSALDPRIDAALVSGHFQPRNEVWREPIYRDVWGLLQQFGDAELAAMIAPRTLILEAAKAPEVAGPPPESKERRGAAPHGVLTTPAVQHVRDEIARVRPSAKHVQLIVSGDGSGPPGSAAALAALLKAPLKPAGPPPSGAAGIDPAATMQEQFDELMEFTQRLVRESPRRREEFWSKGESSRFYRDFVWNEVIGRLPPPSEPARPRSRLIYDEPKFRGYEVVLDVWPGVIAYGILLVPKDIQPGERRPVVVCQHGLEGRPTDVADPRKENPSYHRFAVRLAEEGFVTYAPQNPYIGEDRFRTIQRRAHPLKLSLFSFILGQHQQTLAWLATLPFVDAARIGFYGLSYGGKTAVRVPPLLEGYALSICSADFNEWVWKTTSVDSRYSYMITREYDMLEFNFANVVNYGELASLMAPRPFMVERGHLDGVAPDEWVAYEYAKVRRFYAVKMNMPERTEIEFFNGPHTIHGQSTFAFLRRHLRWPK